MLLCSHLLHDFLDSCGLIILPADVTIGKLEVIHAVIILFSQAALQSIQIIASEVTKQLRLLLLAGVTHSMRVSRHSLLVVANAIHDQIHVLQVGRKTI